MNNFIRTALLCLALANLPASAQSVLTPITQGLVWTPAQWTTAWKAKQDYPATTAIPLFTWSTSGRPGTHAAGSLGYNSTTGLVEWWNGTSWVSSGSGGGGVNPGTVNQLAVYGSPGSIVSGASALNLPFNPTLSTSPTGNATGGSLLGTYSSALVQGATSNASNREFLVNLGLTSNNGAGVANNNGDKVTLYTAAVGQSGTGDLWAFNPLLTMSAGSGTYNAQVIEVDFNPLSVDMGGTDGSAGLPAKVGNGVSISGASDANTYHGTSGIAVDSFGGPSSTTSLWSRGLTLSGYFKYADVAHYAISPVGEDFGGSYSTAAIRVAGSQPGILFLNSGAIGSTGVTLSGPTSGSYTFTLPNGAGTTGQTLQTDGAGNTSWGSATCTGCGVNPGTTGYFGYYATTGSAISGTPKLFYSGGNIGVNTASPASQLTVNGTFAASGNASISGAVSLGSSVQLSAFGAGCLQTNSSGVISAAACSGGVSPGTAGQLAYYASSGSTASGTSSVFISGGNVGINTASPGSQLAVNGTMGVSGAASFGSAVSIGGSFQLAAFGAGCLQTNSSGVISVIACGSGSGSVSSVSSSGAGISVSPTTGAVVVSNTGVTSLGAGTGIGLSATTGGVTVSNSGVTSLTAGSNIGVSASTGGVAVSVNASPSFTSMGIGTASITSTLTVNGTFGISGAAAFNSATSFAGSVQMTGLTGGAPTKYVCADSSNLIVLSSSPC